MKVNFYLQDQKQEQTYIYLVLFIDRRRMKFYTGLRVPVFLWDKRYQRVKAKGVFPNRHNYNRHLDYLEQEVYDKYFELMRSGIRPTTSQIKAHLEGITHKKKRRAITLIEYWQELINRRKTDPGFSPGTVKTYVTSLNHFKRFCRAYGTHDFTQIDTRFAGQFIRYLYSLKHSTNYVDKMVQQLKVVMGQALEDGLTANRDFQKKAFRIKKTATSEVYLNPDEIAAIQKLKFNSALDLDSVRQCFILQCYTGVAYADIHKIGEGNISEVDGVQVLSYYRGKTKKMAALPIHPVVRQIMEPRKWQPFNPIKNQPYNRYLKDICQAAELTQKVNKITNKGGIEEKKAYPKYKLIGSHTARRSFTTNYILTGGTREEVKLMIGHLTQDVTETYIRAEMQKRAALLANKDFFK